MGSSKEFQFSTCLGRHGPYSFFKSMKIGSRTLSLSNFFPVRIYPDSAILSIAEVQLLWTDRSENFASLRLYFLPENTPEGRLRHHGEDEVIALQDKVIIRGSDLLTWLVDESEWDWGFVSPTCSSQDNSVPATPPATQLTKAFLSDKFLKTEKLLDIKDTGSSRVVVLNYERYIRVRSVLKRLEGSSDLSNWLSHPLVLALGGLNVGPNCRLLFSKEVFDYPELEDHELLCNHLAPKLKGRPRKTRRKRDRSLGSESNKSSSSGTSCGSDKLKKPLNGIHLIKPCKLDIEKQQPGSPATPTSLTSNGSRPASPTPMVNGIGGGDTDPSPNDVMVGATTSNGIQILRADDAGNATSQPAKNGQYHPGKKRNLAQLSAALKTSAINIPDPRTPSPPLESKYELESTTIKVACSPSITIGVVNQNQSSPSPPSSSENRNRRDSSEEKYKNSELLGPSLVELAQKLEKSNALQILPIRPSVITKQEQGLLDAEGPRPKKMKTEEYGLASGMTISDFNFMGAKARKGMMSVGQLSSLNKNKSLSAPKPSSFMGQGRSKNNFEAQSFLDVRPAHQMNSVPSKRGQKSSEKIDRPMLSITPVDSEMKKPFGPIFSSPSPFVATNTIYGDPGISKPPNAAAVQLQKSSITNNTNGRSNGILPGPASTGSQSYQDVLDFSVKKNRPDLYSKSQSTPVRNIPIGMDTGCLDLSVKPISQNNKNMFHNISDIPPPNAMNQLGLRLTSEVTLFPSQQQHANHLQQQQLLLQQQQQQRQPNPGKSSGSGGGTKRERERELQSLSRNGLQFSMPSHHNNVLSLNSNHLRQLQTQPKRAPSSSPSFAQGAVGKQGTTSSSSSSKPNMNLASSSHQNPYVWRPAASTTPASSTAPAPSPRAKDNGLPHPHGNSLGKRKASPGQPSSMDRLPLPGHVRGTAAKPTPTMGLTNQRQHLPQQHQQQAQLDKEPTGIPGMSFEQLAQFQNFMMPPVPPSAACYPNIDPAYLSLFGSPFQLPPSVLMRLPPGTLEGLQYYMQQGIPPQFHPGWPNTTTGKDNRGGGHHK